MILYVTRHGETADNARKVFQGQTGKGLNGQGRAQASRLGERLRSHGLTAVVTSDLERAVETARIVADACGLGAPILEPALREVDVGAWSGKSYAEVASLYPEEWAAWEAGIDLRRGGGETYAEMAERIDGALGAVVARHGSTRDDGRRVLVVSHGGAIKSWVNKLLGLPASAPRTLGPITNTSLTIVEATGSDPTTYRLRAWNDAAHLEGLARDEPAAER